MSTATLSESRSIAREHKIWMTAALFVATFILTRHVQISGLSAALAPFTVLVLLAGLQLTSRLIYVIPFLVYACASLVGSLYAGNSPGGVWRFFVISIATLLAFCFRATPIRRWVALTPVLIQAVLIILISAYLAIAQDQALAALARNYVIDQGWGDIYSLNGVYYRVQLVGNSLLPLLWMIAIFSPEKSRFLRGILLTLTGLALVVAGNLTYLLVAGLTVIIWIRRVSRGRLVTGVALVAVFVVGSIFASGSVQEVVDRKFEGSNSSMATRFDQIRTATQAISRDTENFVIGFGLGASFPDGELRDYSHQNYIELQALYMAYQLGIVGTVLYLACLLKLTSSALDRDGFLIFWLFILSCLSNPYILESGQIIASISLVCIFPRGGSWRE